MQVAALLIVGAAKLDGDMSPAQKKVAQAQFESNFSMDEREASQLMISAMHLLGAPQIIDTQLQGLIDKNKDRLLEQGELPDAHQGLLKELDRDRDGKLSQSELLRMRKQGQLPSVRAGA